VVEHPKTCLFFYKEYTKPQNYSTAKMAVTTPKRKKDLCSTFAKSELSN